MSSDDADVAREARRARDLERAVVDVIRKDGTFDALRRRVTEEVSQQAGLLFSRRCPTQKAFSQHVTPLPPSLPFAPNVRLDD